MPSKSARNFKATVMNYHNVAGRSVVLEGPDGQQALIALRAGSIEKLRLNYPRVDGPVDVIFPHTDYDHLVTDPTGAGSAVLAPISNRSRDGQMHVVCPEFSSDPQIFQLPLNFPADSSRHALHGNARTTDLELMERSEELPTVAYVTLRYVTSGNNKYGNYPEGVEFVFKSMLFDGCFKELSRITNHSDVPIPPSLSKHYSFLPGYVEDGENTDIKEMKVKLDTTRMLDLDADNNVTGKVIDFELESEPALQQYNLGGSQPVEIGDKDIDHVYLLSGQRKMSLLDPKKKVGIMIRCFANIPHGTVWTNGKKRQFVAMEPGLHAGTYNSQTIATELGQNCIMPGKSMEYGWSIHPITKLQASYSR